MQEKPTEYSYTHKRPELLRISDVVLKLDDGTELPAHSHYLAWVSSKYSAMFRNGPLFGASALKKAVLPLTDCSKATVISLLLIVYQAYPIEHVVGRCQQGLRL